MFALLHRQLYAKRWLVFGCTALITLEGFLASVTLASLIPAVAVFSSNSADPTEDTLGLSSWFENFGIHALLLPAALLALKFLFSYIRIAIAIHLGETLRAIWVSKMLEHVLNSSFQKNARSPAGEILSNVLDLPRGGQNFVVGLAGLIALIVQSLFLVFIMSLVNIWVLSAGVFAGFCFYIAFYRPVTKQAGTLGQRNISFLQRITAQVGETISSMREIKLLSTTDLALQDADALLQGHRKLETKTRIMQALPSLFVELITAFAILCFYIFVLFTGDTQTTTSLPLIVFFAVGAQRLVGATAAIVTSQFKVVTNFQRFKLMDQLQSQLMDIETETNKIPMPEKARQLKLVNVSYSYSTPIQILHDVNLEIDLSKVTVMLGESGSGKSTLLDLIVKFLEPTSGSIEIEAQQLNHTSTKAWRDAIGYVSQDPMLFSGSIKDNLILKASNVTKEQIEEAIKFVELDDFITSLPQGYETQIYRGGSSLSGGQRKRLAIARCLIRKPKFLILDESLSSLDEELERRIIHRVRETPNLGLIMVTHRTLNIDLADHFLNLSDGKVVSTSHLPKRL